MTSVGAVTIPRPGWCGSETASVTAPLQVASWDLAREDAPPPGTRVFRSERTILVWPEWAGLINGAYQTLRERWAATRPPILQSQYCHARALMGRRDLVARRCRDIDSLTSMADAISPHPVRFGNGWQTPVWELDAVTRQVRRGELVIVGEGSDEIRAGQADPLRLRGLDELRLRPEILVNPVCGVVGSGVDRRLDWETTAPVAGRTPLWDGRRVRPLTWSGQTSSYGRSRIAALLESIERLVGARQHVGGSMIASRSELVAQGREHRIPDDFGVYGEAAYESRFVRYSPQDDHEWVEAESLRDGRPVLVPREFAFFGQPLSTGRWAVVCSSGIASGSTREEALAFGLMELIERDVFVNSWYARVPGQRIKVDSVPGLHCLLNRAELLGHTIDLVSLPGETGLPVMVAVARGAQAAAFGAAAHPDPIRAAHGAVEEAWTYLPERLQAVASNRSRCLDMRERPELVREIDDHPLQCVLPEAAEDLEAYLGPTTPKPLDAAVPPSRLAGLGAWELVRSLVVSLGRLGIEPLAVRCTAPWEETFGLETWSVLAPGLSPLDFGWHRQRVLQMPRPFDYCRNLGRPVPDHLLNRPHPFS